MKKRFITGVLLLALTAGGFSTFTSCKDTDEDLYTDLNSKQVSLEAALNALKISLNDYVTKNQLTTDLAALEQELKEYADSKEHHTQEEIEGWITAKLNAFATQYKLQAILDLFNGTDGQKSLAERLADLENKTACSCTPDFTDEEVATLKQLIAMNAQLKGLFGENGTINTMQKEIDDLDKALNGENGLVKKIENIESVLGDITPEQFQELVGQGNWVKANQEALQTLIGLKDKLDGAALDALNSVYEDLSEIQEMYNNIYKSATLPEGETAWWNYGEVMQKIKDNSAAIRLLQDDVDMLFKRLNGMVTSLIIQATQNPVFPSFNTPFGINSLVLMTCYGERATSLPSFPNSGVGAECYSSSNDDIDWTQITSESYQLSNSTLIVNRNEDGTASLGNFWFTVNPGTVNRLELDGFSIVNSRDDDPIVKVTNITKDDETVLKFGFGSRAAGNGNGLYQASAVVAPEDLSKIKINVEPGLVQALKDAVQNRTASDMLQMMKKVYNQLHNICDANALRYSYEAVTGKDASGNWITTPQKVYSNYGLAATAYKPLSFATLKGTSIHNIPTFGSIEISKDMVDLDLGTFEVNGNDFSLKFNFGKPEFGPLGEIKVKTTVHAELTGTSDGKDVTVSGEIPVEIDITKEAQDIQDNMVEAINEWLGEGESSLDARVEKSIWYALFNDPNAKDSKYPYDPKQPTGVVADLVSQVNSMMGSIQGKLYDLVDQINKDYLGKVNRLIDKYNTVANRINRVLSDPNHYLQSVLLYRKAGDKPLNANVSEDDLPFGVLSTDPSSPTQFHGNGEAISLWATTYNFETLAPAFKKIVGVIKVTGANGVEKPQLAKQANDTMAKILNGDQNRVALNVKGAVTGDRYEIAYQALDYTGHTSTVKCYIQIVR